VSCCVIVVMSVRRWLVQRRTVRTSRGRGRAWSRKTTRWAVQARSSWDTPRPAVSGSPASGGAAMISSWMNYVPSSVWDQRLGERSGADRRAK
jgi:hypothetical protein